MFKSLATVIISLFIGAQSYAQYSQEDYDFYRMKPSIGLSLGSSNYIGDISSVGALSHLAPGGAQLVFDYPISQSIVAKASLAYHRLSYVNVHNNDFANFKTKMGGINLGVYYRFDNDVIMSTRQNLSLRLGGGFSFFATKSKSDIYDKDGNRYYFWNTGIHKDRPMDDPEASDAIDLVRDYEFETVIEDAPNGLPSPYAEFSMIYKITPRFTTGLTYEHHFTFTDLLDGNDSKKRKDQFNFINFSLSYSLSKDFRADEKAAAVALEDEDSDDDGIVDVMDLCPRTKANVEVDSKGCPLDTDEDGVPDYLDKETGTAKGAIVNEEGKTYTAEELSVIDLLSSGKMLENENWQTYMDKYPVLFTRFGFIPLKEERTVVGKD